MSQQEYLGYGSIKNLETILKDNSPKHIFLVTGNKSYSSSGAEKILKDMLNRYSITHFVITQRLPIIEDIVRGIDIFRKKNCDFVIAVGGGSVLDVGKLVNIFASQDGDPIDYIEKKKSISMPGKKFVAIPTTSGSGSEATHFAVTYVNGNKFSIANMFILPNYAIVDPQLTLNCPPDITASSGIDAFSQAVESYWAINATEKSRQFSKEAIKIILKHLVIATNNPTMESRIEMARASNLAGKAINISKTTAPHAISYPITFYFNVPHGQAVCLTLPKLFIHNSMINENNAVNKIRLDEFKRTFSELISLLDAHSPETAAERISTLISSIGLKTRLSDLGIGIQDFDKILENVNVERIANNPVIVTKQELYSMLMSIL